RRLGDRVKATEDAGGIALNRVPRNSGGPLVEDASTRVACDRVARDNARRPRAKLDAVRTGARRCRTSAGDGTVRDVRRRAGGGVAPDSSPVVIVDGHIVDCRGAGREVAHADGDAHWSTGDGIRYFPGGT